MINTYDIVIIWAWPAGLTTAHELANSKKNISIGIIDKGNFMEKRVCPSIENWTCTNCKICSITHGIWWAGLLSDGKLALDGYVGNEFWIENTLIKKAIKKVYKLFSLKNVANNNEREVINYKKKFEKNNLEFKYYPVVKLNYASRFQFVNKIIDRLVKEWVKIFPSTEVLDFVKKGNIFIIKTNQGPIRSKKLIVAPWKVWFYWLSKICEKNKLNFKKNKLYIGLRMEFDTKVIKEIVKITEDPKIKMKCEDGITIKTHCLSNKWIVVIADYNWLKIIDWNYLEARKSKNCAVNLIQNIDIGKQDWYLFAKKFIKKINKYGEWRPVIQTLWDFENKKSSTRKKILKNKIQPSLKDITPWEISQFYPDCYIQNLLLFLKRTNNIIKWFSDKENLLYSPFVEWWTDEIETSEYFETKLSDLFVIGDWWWKTQWIVSSVIQWIIVSDKIKKDLYQ